MEFYIHRDRYFLRKEENGACALMALKSNRVIELEARLRVLTDMTDRWMNAEQVARVLMLTVPGRADVVSALWSALFSLHAAGIAELRNIPSFGGTGPRWVQLGDYQAVSSFCTANLDKGFSCSVYINPAYYSCSSVYHILAQQTELMLVLEENSIIRALAVMGFSTRFFGGPMIELKSVIFDAGMDEQACREAIHTLMDYACSTQKGKLNKIRYEYIHPRQDFLVSALKESSFQESAHFRAELKNGADLILLDRML